MTRRRSRSKAPTDYDNCTVYDNNGIASASNSPDVASNDATVNCLKPALTVDKSGNGPVNAGEDVVFTIVVDNGGPGAAKAVTLSDTLPSGTAGAWTIDTQPAGNPCSISSGVLNCAFGDMASGDSKTVTVKASTDYDNCSVYDNTATASSTNAPDGEDDATVTCQKPNISVKKTGNGPISAGRGCRILH